MAHVSKRFDENAENVNVDKNRKNINYRNRNASSSSYYNSKQFGDKLIKTKNAITSTAVSKNNDQKHGKVKSLSVVEDKVSIVSSTELTKDVTFSENKNKITESKEKDILRQKKEEIKELANICIEQKLSVNNENIQIVRKLKEKRMLEEQISKNENIKNLQDRRRILEEIEYHEWADREKRIKELQEKKMKLLKKVMLQRDAEKADKVFYEVDKIMQERDKNKDKIIENFEKEKAKDIKNLFIERKNLLKTVYNEKNDIIDDINDYTSNYNLKLERNGIIPNKMDQRTENKIDNIFNNTHNKLNDLNITTDDLSKINVTWISSKENKRKTDVTAEVEKKQNKQLIDSMYRFLNKEQKETKSDEYLKTDIDIKSETKKTQTNKIIFPLLTTKTYEEDIFEKNVLYLQNILRGKAVQMLMNDGKHAYSDLIKELKTYEKIDQYSSNEINMFKKENFEKLKVDSYLENIQGKYISELLDSLSNELEKYEEERKIAVLVKYAERERRLKECKEKGKRQAEYLLREKEDYLFNEIMGLNNQTVDSYLEDILSNAINDASKEEALIRTKKKAEQLNEIYNSLNNQNEEKNKLIVKELVGNFIIPYVDKQRGLEFDAFEQKKNNAVANFAAQHVFAKTHEAF
ncbi:conserved protein, unknown function [Hepatocystis sp. ex Piliocolobus tephrosceles]|nr:conserved protein, unknown function [Hepatocystis sp. ex Piliocolobus tephrosceles]